MSEKPLALRFQENLGSLRVGEEPTRFVVAFSGGLDSTVLLHLLRFHGRAAEVTAAHFDHRMRADSGADARWAEGLCRAWGVPLHLGSAARELRGEDDARRARYEFLFGVKQRVGASWLVTAHHADDQAETVLFRALRGTGVAGLAGIPARSRRGLLRPLLPFWREELESYAVAHALSWRNDPTNETLGPVRNRIRHLLLPQIEREIAPGARRNLVSLASLARQTESALRREVGRAWAASVRREAGEFVLVRGTLGEYHPAVATRVLRRVLRRLGGSLGGAGTRSLLLFITDAPSGRTMHLPGGLRATTEFELARIGAAGDRLPTDQVAAVPRPAPGDAFATHLRLAGQGYRVVVREESGSDQDADRDAIWRARLSIPASRFPLLLRSRQPGDRVRTTGGTKSLKKLMIERRIPRRDRDRRPVLVDADQAVVWVAGIGGLADSPGPDDIELNIAVYDD